MEGLTRNRCASMCEIQELQRVSTTVRSQELAQPTYPIKHVTSEKRMRR